MLRKKYICYNGNYVAVDEAFLFSSNRAFKYGDAIFETMFATGTRVMFFNEHFDRLQRSMRILKLEKDKYFTAEKLLNYITRLLHRNRYFQGVNIRLTIFRKEGGKYNPVNNGLDFVIETTKLSNDHYVVNLEKIKIGIFNEIKKPSNILSTLKSTNALLFVLASLYAKEMGWNDCVLLNEEERVCETIISNIFVVKENMIFTPDIGSFCLPGIMRGQVINIFLQLQYRIMERQVVIDDLQKADEIILTNSMGVRWVHSFGQKFYGHKMTDRIIEVLNKNIDSPASNIR